MNRISNVLIAIFAIGLMFVVSLLEGNGCSRRNNGTNQSSPSDIVSEAGGLVHRGSYTVDYKMVTSDNGCLAYMDVTVKGPAAKLAVILVDPYGKPNYKIIEKDDMIVNVKMVQLYMEENSSPGVYTLIVKTMDPEHVVLQQPLSLCAGQLVAKDIAFYPRRDSSTDSTYLCVIVDKEGGLPVKLANCITTIDGNRYGTDVLNPMLSAKQNVITVKIWPANPLIGWFGLNQSHDVKISLSYGFNNKTAEFEKNITLPPHK